MHISDHCKYLTTLLLAWETQVHSELGYFPENFQDLCRQHVEKYLKALEKELNDELCAVQDALRKVTNSSHKISLLDEEKPNV